MFTSSGWVESFDCLSGLAAYQIMTYFCPCFCQTFAIFIYTYIYIYPSNKKHLFHARFEFGLLGYMQGEPGEPFGNLQWTLWGCQPETSKKVCHMPSYLKPTIVKLAIEGFNKNETHMGVSKNRGNIPQIIHFYRVWNHYINHPFCFFFPLFLETPI